jgi:predicted nucleic acid-binding protein
VFDTNIIVSALLLKNSTSRQALDKANDTGQLLLSTESERMTFLAALVRKARLLEPRERIVVCRDPKDNKFLELAVAGNAKYLVTGDQDLLVLHPFRTIAIVQPNNFLAG